MRNSIEPQLSFNYLGRFRVSDSREWEIASENNVVGGGRALQMPMSHCLEVTSMTQDSEMGPKLIAHWFWAPSLLQKSEVSVLAEEWFDALKSLVNYVAEDSLRSIRTPSDVKLSGITQDDIDQLERDYEWEN